MKGKGKRGRRKGQGTRSDMFATPPMYGSWTCKGDQSEMEGADQEHERSGDPREESMSLQRELEREMFAFLRSESLTSKGDRRVEASEGSSTRKGSASEKRDRGTKD